MRRWLAALALLALVGCTSEHGASNLHEEFQHNPGEYHPLEPVWVEDRLHQRETPTSELLFVIDDSLSMTEDQAKLRDEMSYMIQSLHDANLDYRIAVTTTSWMHLDKEMSNFLRINPMTKKWIDRDTENPIQTFGSLTQVGVGGDSLEKGIYTTYVSLRHKKNESFFRKESPLHIFLVSDEPDGTEYGTGEEDDIPERQHVWDALDDHERRAGHLTFTSIVMSADDTSCKGRWPVEVDPSDYLAITNRHPGLEINICGEWGEAVDVLTEDILSLSSSFYLSKIPHLDYITVFAEKEGITTEYDEGRHWYYDQKTNAVIFYEIIHDPETVIVIKYITASSAIDLEE
jgi:hypothetical protein